MALPSFSIELHLQDPFQAELGVHDPHEINRLLIQTNEIASKAIFKTELQQVAYGHFSDRTPAALIVFQSQFLFSSHNRIKEATIRLALADTHAPNDPQMAPRIVKIAPMWSQGKSAQKKTSSTTSFGASLGASPSAIEPQTRTTSERQQTRHAEIKGIIASHHPRKHAGIMNRVIWNVEENDVQQVGIPPFFRGAILVRYERQFQMVVDVDVVQGFTDSILQFLRKSKRDRDDPVHFTPGLPYPPGMKMEGDCETIDLEGLVELPVPKPIPGV